MKSQPRLAVGLCGAGVLLFAACGDDAPRNKTFSAVSSYAIGGPGIQWTNVVAAGPDRALVGASYVDGFSISDRQLPYVGGVDAVALSIADDGSLAWAYELAGTGDDFIVGLATGADGSVFVSGAATSGATFAGQPLVVDGDSSVFVAKLDGEGNLAWARTGRGMGFQSATAVVPTSDGGAYVAGDFTADLDLGAGPATATDLGDGFLARFTASGALQWFQVIGGAGAQHVAQLAVGPDGDVVLIGHYNGQLALGPAPLPDNPVSDYTPFVARFGADGALAWVQTNLLPADLNHMGHLDHTQVHHPGVAVMDLSVAVGHSGDVAAGVTFGGSFAHSDQDFEAPAINRLMLTSISADGTAVSQSELSSTNGSVRLGRAIDDDGQTYLMTSWKGQLASSPKGQAVASTGHASLLIVGATAGGFETRGILSLRGAALEGGDAALRADGSLVVAATRTDLSSLDRDIFVTLFR